MKKLSKKFTLIIFRFFCLVFAILLFVLIPNCEFAINDNLDRIYGSFVGKNSEYNGLIEIWNIDTFEGGSASKYSFLNDVALKFQKRHRGVYVMVRNITEKECENMIMQGQLPDLFSCSYGVAEKIKPYLMPFEEYNFDLNSNFLQAGQDDKGNLFGAAWCSGLYFLISTQEYLKKAGVDFDNSYSLAKNAFSLGYKTTGKKPKNVYSIAFSTKGYLMPKNAILTYNAQEAIISELSFDDLKISSQYEAYIDFLLNKSVMLIGSQRDAVRLKNRVSAGKIVDVVMQPVFNSCDLVQFAFMSKSDDALKNKYKQFFVEFLLDRNVQRELSKISMFSTAKSVDYELEFCSGCVVGCQKLNDLKLLNIFTPSSEIKKLQ